MLSRMGKAAATLLVLVALVLPQGALAAPPVFSLTSETVCAGTGEGPCGSVWTSADKCKRNCILSVEALPTDGWVFDHWEGDAAGSENPTTVRMTSDKHVIAVFTDGGPPPPPPPPPTGCEPYTKSGEEVVGYFIQWGVYRRDYHVRDIVDSCSADKLTAINYAFAGIKDDLTCMSLDPFADYEKRYDADESVDGVADTVGQPLKGNFNQLRKLKQLYPDIRVLISIGGWNDSDKFSDAALPQNRESFVASCIDMFIRGMFDPLAGVVDPDVFDGIDIDWEYPGACGATCNWREEDTENFTALLAEFREQLTALAGTTGKTYLLTAAVPASEFYHRHLELPEIALSLDWMNIMAYDFHGSWEPSGPTNHHSNLFVNPADPSEPPMSARTAVDAYIAKGVLRSQLVLGLPFYGRGWARVRDGGTDGLFQEAGRIPRGTWERGNEDYEVLKGKGFAEYWDGEANAAWLYNGNEFWTYDSPAAIERKMDYIRNESLRGVMFWELSGDDAEGTLIDAIGTGLQPAAP